MSKYQSEFNHELDRLYHIRTDRLRHMLGPKIKGKSPKFNRDIRNRVIENLKEITAEALVKDFTRKEIKRRVEKKRSWLITRGKGVNLDAKKENFKEWYDKKCQGHRTCIYIFWRGRKCLYVGKTQKGPNRIISHIYDKRFGNPSRITLYLTRAKRNLPILECLAIHNFNPRINKTKAAKKKFTAKCPLCKRTRQIEKDLRRIFSINIKRNR